MKKVAHKFAFIEEELAKRHRSQRFRSLKMVEPVSEVEVDLNGRIMLNFCSNDYLGLSKHFILKERATEFIERYGAGSTASRLICGTYRCVGEVEEKLASLKGTEAALILNSGFQANVSLLPALVDRESLILSDSLNHRSIIEGSRLSCCSVKVFRHNDMKHLRHLLAENNVKYHRILIITESVFSMDGDQSDINELVKLSEEFHALLIVDEAHATGVMGRGGMGLTCGKKVDVTVGTFGKALGSFGSYITCSKQMRDYLVNCCSGFIYSTALPPPVIGAIDAALDLIPTLSQERRELQEKAEFLRVALHEMGWDTGKSTTQIVPVITGGESETLSLSKWLEKQGILALAIRPPTVEVGHSRIRLALSTMHGQEQINQLIDAFRRWARAKKR